MAAIRSSPRACFGRRLIDVDFAIVVSFSFTLLNPSDSSCLYYTSYHSDCQEIWTRTSPLLFLMLSADKRASVLHKVLCAQPAPGVPQVVDAFLRLLDGQEQPAVHTEVIVLPQQASTSTGGVTPQASAS